MACLASRIQDGVTVSKDKLSLVENAESAVRNLGFEIARVRYHESGSDSTRQIIARVEVPNDQIARLISPDIRNEIATRLRSLGFHHVTLDLEGYKRGGRAVA